MEEITLTGGTLLSNNHNNLGADGKAETVSAASREALRSHDMTQQHHEQPTKDANQKNDVNHAHDLQHQLQSNQTHQNKACCHRHAASMPAPVVTLKMSPPDLVRNQTQSQIMMAITVLTKMGNYKILQDIIQAWNEFKGKEWVDNTLKGASQTDAEGHTLLHWSAKRTDDLRFIQFWSQYIPLTTRTKDSTGMTPLHWAVTESDAFAVIHYILTTPNGTGSKTETVASKDDLLECRDGSGCNPLLLAAQHGNVEVVAYLVHQYHAKLNAVDENGDSATHWAAYKGSSAVLGLLAYYEKQDNSVLSMLQKPDTYGQTPLHLAALRGHSVACQYILRHIAGNRNEHRKEAMQLLTLKDRNGRTPYELAIHKQKPHTAAVLQQAERMFIWLNKTSGKSAWIPRSAQDAKTLVQILLVDWLCNSHRWRQWMGIQTGVDDPMDVAPSFPNYYVMLQIILNFWFTYAVYIPIFSLGDGVLWDKTTLHILQALLTAAIAFCLYKTQTTNPGRLDDSCREIAYWRRLYGETLASYADTESASENGKQGKLQLCHTCHIARPPRSKHDRSAGVCVLLFDHNCPFVGNTVGLYNYKWFYFLLMTMTWYFIQHIYLLWIYARRTDTKSENVSIWTLVAGSYLAVHILMAGTMFIYHTQLMLANLTTNEHLNIKKYEYLWTTVSTHPNGAQERRYSNPWDRGFIANIMDRLQPSHASYMVPEIQERLLSSNETNNELEMV